MSNNKPEPDFIEVDEVIMPDQDASSSTWSRMKGNTSSKKSGQSTPAAIPRSPIAKLLSYLLDEAFVIPGTNIRIGLDPILGLIPGGGEAIASVAGAFIVGEAYRKGVSLKTVAQMAGNLLLNAGVGAVPVIGDAFSMLFRSNKRNYEILDSFLKNPPPMGKPRRLWPVMLGLGLLALAINVAVWLTVYFVFSTLFNR